MLEGLIPRLRVSTVYDIDLAMLKEKGIQGIITDLDNTLVGAKDPLATPQLAAWLEEVKRQKFKVVIVSNNDHTRVSRFATPLDIQFVHAARKPAQRAFHKALQLMGLTPDQTVVVGDQMLTDVLGGNRIGMFTILVQPIAIQDEGWMTRVNRRIERIVTARLRKKGLWHEEERH
ncbi:YqeG family HAD IIIA-type phosphatase [Paenibacillus apiarius]|uniref:YqeG family HAD IIIA-type phosphatase n=1 Tax=Paenibacillus apiarius TaxID=46240 RepID=A0ABT4DWN9_9BACL|nr:YqeG family HAD IIIA-type phosphatase [Paenibacillus apiarius]MBN3525848.1 YqeG family HAD IIIA-type phosphatase [Paenibacillus apiarius]MCY9516898.1 YqeG family HAD IIIA-type phosphatase [Paenibacillus apiarius]MCY9521744.1 YqeG family HAD IIIA-type phosphatase [Paenibacillus apiarius]MCY9551575.1 YqeG family HAD IIIA-type phosphatase [Paenibacillus apiarius]MCY9558730.1 YqeG family HAD IIIA-type phosphatase [Paenibacillus apiarius]